MYGWTRTEPNRAPCYLSVVVALVSVQSARVSTILSSRRTDDTPLRGGCRAGCRPHRRPGRLSFSLCLMNTIGHDRRDQRDPDRDHRLLLLPRVGAGHCRGLPVCPSIRPSVGLGSKQTLVLYVIIAKHKHTHTQTHQY